MGYYEDYDTVTPPTKSHIEMLKICTHLNSNGKSTFYKRENGSFRCQICGLVRWDDPNIDDEERILSYFKDHLTEINNLVEKREPLLNIGVRTDIIMRACIVSKMMSLIDNIEVYGSSAYYSSIDDTNPEVMVLAVLMDIYIDTGMGIIDPCQPRFLSFNVIKDKNGIIELHKHPDSQNIITGNKYVESELRSKIISEIFDSKDKNRTTTIYQLLFEKEGEY